MTITTRRRADTIVTRTRHFELMNEPDRQAGDWWEIESGLLDYFLDLLPPIWMDGGGFLMCEEDREGTRHGFFHDGRTRRCYCALFDCTTGRKGWYDLTNAIFDEVTAPA